MPVTLNVDTARWRGHVRTFVDGAAAAGVAVVPVTKGNGYGFGNAVLAAETSALGVPTLAVGTYEEIGAVVEPFAGDVLVLSPWRPGQPGGPSGGLDDDRLIHTVSRLDDLQRIADGPARPRVVVEVLTSMRRHGIDPNDLPEAAKLFDAVRFEGFALHLPLTGDHTDEARALAQQAFAALPDAAHARTLWVSHLSPVQAAAVGRDTSAAIRLRAATAMWLGDRAALTARATVLDVHQVRRGESYGYRQRRARRDGSIVIVAGGTAQGIAMEAPTAASTARQRAVALAKGALESAGRAVSPFRIGGRRRWFAEPPHMQCSMIWLPAGVAAPAVGDDVDVEVRFTTTTFDDIVWD